MLGNINPLLLIGIIVAIVIIILIVILLIVKAVKRKKYFSTRSEAGLKMIEAFGGRANIVSATNNGSRLSIVLNDYSLFNEEQAKALGVSSFIKMSNKITLVVGEEAAEIANLINKE